MKKAKQNKKSIYYWFSPDMCESCVEKVIAELYQFTIQNPNISVNVIHPINSSRTNMWSSRYDHNIYFFADNQKSWKLLNNTFKHSSVLFISENDSITSCIIHRLEQKERFLQYYLKVISSIKDEDNLSKRLELRGKLVL